MDACDSVEKEIEKVINKFTDIKNQSEESINEIISVLRVILVSLSKYIENNLISKSYKSYNYYVLDKMDSEATISEEQVSELKNVINRCKTKLQTIGTDHRALHASVSKVGKAIDRHFTPDYQSIAPLDLYESEKHLEIMNQIIAEHFYRQGMNEVADSLVTESSLPPEEDIHLELFADLYQMWEGITNRDLSPGKNH